MENKYFMHRIKRSTKGVYDKGIEVHDSIESAKQSYHAYLGAYAYGHSEETNYVSCMITDMWGGRVIEETWMLPEVASGSGFRMIPWWLVIPAFLVGAFSGVLAVAIASASKNNSIER